MKIETLKSRKEFKEVLDKGTKIVTSNFVLFYSPSDTPKFGFIAAKRHFKRAVDRNRAKRIIRTYVKSAKFSAEYGHIQPANIVLVLRVRILQSTIHKQ